MPWISIGSVGTGQMPGEREWILLCYDLALSYLKFRCGEPPPGCELDVMWQEHDLGEYPALGVYYDFEPPWAYIHRCEAELERFDNAIDWAEIQREQDFADDDDPTESDNELDEETDDAASGGQLKKWDIDEEIDRLFDDSSICRGGSPIAVILMGGVATGKTTLRKQQYSRGYVVIDAADIFLSLSKGEVLSFPDALEEPLNQIGRLVAKRALFERRNIVTEIIGAEYEPTTRLVEALKGAGYRAEMVFVSCGLGESFKRSANRGENNISAYYAEAFQRAWLIEACNELGPAPGGDMQSAPTSGHNCYRS